MSSFFIKKLQRQEMGSPTIENGQIKFHRGRYLLISKEFISFFPHLSTTVLNDCTALPIQVNNDNEIVYAQYVYHNSKYIIHNFSSLITRHSSLITRHSSFITRNTISYPICHCRSSSPRQRTHNTEVLYIFPNGHR